MKNCSRCKTEKGSREFAIYDGKPFCWCRQCQRDSAREYREKNPGKANESATRWRKNNTAQVKAAAKAKYAKIKSENPDHNRTKNLMRFYGITIEQYDAMYRAQNGGCAVCARVNLSGRRLAVDHDHKTGKVRGLLCSRCNSAIGLARESLEVLRSTVAYLEKHETLTSIGL